MNLRSLLLYICVYFFPMYSMKRCRGKDGLSDSSIPPPKRTAHWSKGLLHSMEDPNMILTSDGETVTIRDMYPKAKHHYLVLPRENISSLKALDKSHVVLLTHMLKVSKQFVGQLNEPNLEFQYGFHSVASMARLHMHIISRDFDSFHLKTKKHWNSFTTDFFLDAEAVIYTLETVGKIDVDKEKCELFLKQPLQCHMCSEKPSTMPKLKLHIKQHTTE